MLTNNRPYIIGETAFHHEGDIDFLKRLIDDISEMKLDAIKMHLLLDLHDYMISSHVALDSIEEWLISPDDWKTVVDYACNKSLEVVLLCNDPKSIDFAISLGDKVKAIELHATGINDYFLLEKAANFHGTVILGIGGSTIDEMQYAIDFLKTAGKEDVFLMYGFQNYPTDYKDVNFSKMIKIRDLFKLPVGYADHSDPSDKNNEFVSSLASSIGFNVLEKHYTPVFGEERIDFEAAVSKDQMLRIKEMMDVGFKTYGDGRLAMSEAELKYGDVGPMKKAIVAREDIKEGDILTKENLCFKRTNDSAYLKQGQFAQLIGSKAIENIGKDELIDFSKVEYAFKKQDFSQFHIKE